MSLLIRHGAVTTEEAHNAVTTGPFTAPVTATHSISMLRRALREAGVHDWIIEHRREGLVRLSQIKRVRRRAY